MKKRLLTCAAVLVLALSLLTPVIAAETMPAEPTNTATEQEIAPRTEVTQIVWRIHNGRHQFRVWGATSGQWLTDWIYF
jgi:hypothetical protein